METFTSTSDGKFPCLRHKGVLYYLAPDELAKALGITEYTIELDPGQLQRDQKAAARARVRAHNLRNAGIERFGF